MRCFLDGGAHAPLIHKPKCALVSYSYSLVVFKLSGCDKRHSTHVTIAFRWGPNYGQTAKAFGCYCARINALLQILVITVQSRTSRHIVLFANAHSCAQFCFSFLFACAANLKMYIFLYMHTANFYGAYSCQVAWAYALYFNCVILHTCKHLYSAFI